MTVQAACRSSVLLAIVLSAPTLDGQDKIPSYPPELVRFKSLGTNPLLPVKQNKSSGIVVPDGDKFRLYTMHPEGHVHVSEP